MRFRAADSWVGFDGRSSSTFLLEPSLGRSSTIRSLPREFPASASSALFKTSNALSTVVLPPGGVFSMTPPYRPGPLTQRHGGRAPSLGSLDNRPVPWVAGDRTRRECLAAV